MKRGDWILIVAVALAAVLSWPALSAADAPGRYAVVKGPSGETRVDLSKNGTYRIAGRAGGLVLTVVDGGIHVSETRCPDRRCVAMGHADHEGDGIVCVPNGITVSVGGGDAPDVDAIAR